METRFVCFLDGRLALTLLDFLNQRPIHFTVVSVEDLAVWLNVSSPLNHCDAFYKQIKKKGYKWKGDVQTNCFLLMIRWKFPTNRDFIFLSHLAIGFILFSNRCNYCRSRFPHRKGNSMNLPTRWEKISIKAPHTFYFLKRAFVKDAKYRHCNWISLYVKQSEPYRLKSFFQICSLAYHVRTILLSCSWDSQLSLATPSFSYSQA